MLSLPRERRKHDVSETLKISSSGRRVSRLAHGAPLVPLERPVALTRCLCFPATLRFQTHAHTVALPLGFYRTVLFFVFFPHNEPLQLRVFTSESESGSLRPRTISWT